MFFKSIFFNERKQLVLTLCLPWRLYNKGPTFVSTGERKAAAAAETNLLQIDWQDNDQYSSEADITEIKWQ